MKAAPALLALLIAVDLAACGSGGQQGAQNSPDQLDEAAAQSDPAAAQAIEAAADNGATPQQALEAGANAQAATLPPATHPTPESGAVGAKPHAAGDPVPPPRVKTGQ